MKKFYLAFVLIYIFMYINLSAQDSTMLCMATAPENISVNQIGGYLLPSEGTINVLFIFAQFPDDNFDTSNSTWVKGQAPIDMQGWVDQTWTTNPTQGSMTHYFNEMSFNKLKFTGKTVSVITPHSRQWYLENNKKRGDIHKEIIQQLDQTWDFAQFDNWNFEGYYNHINQPDGVVDMIFIVWRNIAHEYPTSPTDSVKLIYNKLNMGRYGDLGNGWPDIYVDSGQRVIKMGFWPIGNTPGGSGATMTDWFSENMFRFCIHEFGHYLEGGNDQHVGHGFWGMLSGWGIKSFVANSFERHRLGWINLEPNTILSSPNQTIQNVTLPDFVTSGVAYRLVSNAATNEYFYIENHQKLSFWENNQMFLRSPYGNVENGIYVLRQDGSGGDDKFIKCLAADGRYNWTVNQRIQSPWGPEILPVFKKLNPDGVNGYTDLDWIPWWWNGVYQGEASIHFIEDPVTGQPVLAVKSNGDGTDAFRTDYNQMFSPYSNPNSQRLNKTATPFGFNINGFNSGVASLNLYVGTSLDAPPSKPQNLKLSILNNHPVLTWEANIEDDMAGYNIYRSENGYIPQLIGYVTKRIRTYTDYTANTSIPSDNYDYTVKAKDNTGLISVASDKVSVMALAPKINIGVSEKIPSEYVLAQNYPNPFNHTTNLNYSVKDAGLVKIKVYNILGSEVAELVNENKESGYHSVEFDASNLPSGVYIYSLQVNGFLLRIKCCF